MNIKIDLNVCRVCLKQPPENSSMIPLFDELGWHVKFREATGLEPNEDDGLSKMLCPKCWSTLKLICEYKKQAHFAENHMKKFLNSVKLQFTETFESVAGSEGYEEPDETVFNYEESIESEKPVNVSTTIGMMPKTGVGSISSLISVDEDQLNENNTCENRDTEDDNLVDYCESEPPECEEATPDHFEETSDFPKISYLDNFEDTDENEKNSVDVKQRIVYEEAGNSIEQHENEFEHTEEQILTIEAQDIKRNQEVDLIRNACLKCNKTFSTKTNLMRHAATHDGKKPYMCNLCGRSFTQNGSLKQHLYIHSNIKPYSCEICQKSFTQGKSLKFHKLRHSGEKPFECIACAETDNKVSFRQKDALRRHIQVKHPSLNNPDGIKYECPTCQRVVISKYALKIHMKKHFEK